MSDAMPAWAREMLTLLVKADGRQQGFGDRLEALDGRLEALNGRLEALDGRLDLLEGGLAEVRTRLNGMATRDELHRVRADIMSRIDRLQEDLTRQTEEGAVNYNMAATTAGRIVSLEETVISLTRLVRRVQSRLDDLEGKQQGH